MFDGVENVKIVSARHCIGKRSGSVVDRTTHTVFIRMRGTVRYDFGDHLLDSREGELFFVPKGSSYTYETLTEDEWYTCVNFEADFAFTPRPFLCSMEGFPESEYMGRCFSDLWNFGTQAGKYRCISLFFALLSHMSSAESASYCEKKKFALIEPAAEYLKVHTFDSSLKIECLHRLCGISHTYFRKIFVSRYGMTPQKYILTKRLAHAKSILDSGDYNTIGEVAASAGFNDPMYFSKAFKRVYGVSPSDAGKGEGGFGLR